MAPHVDSSLGSPNSYSKPRPRPPRTPKKAAQVRIQNRRRAYLDRNPAYFKSAENELADPLLYDRLVRRYQTPSEREAEGRSKGYARVLESSLLRGEERLVRLREETTDAANDTRANEDFKKSRRYELEEHIDTEEPDSNVTTTSAAPALSAPTTASTANASSSSGSESKAAARAQWESFLRERFVRGDDEDFLYGPVDEDDEYDALERADALDTWFDEEEAQWATSGGESEDAAMEDVVACEETGGGHKFGDGDSDGKKGRWRRQIERTLHGETGIQDF